MATIGIWSIWQRFPDDTVFASVVTAIVGAVIVPQLFWKAFGREIVTVDKTALTLRIEVAGIGWTRRYDLKAISHLRTAAVRQLGRDMSGSGFLSFDYDSDVPRSESLVSMIAGLNMYSYEPKRPHFGKGLSEAEGVKLMRVIEDHAGVNLTATSMTIPSGASQVPVR